MKPETDDERILELDDAGRNQIYYYLDEGNSKEDLITMYLERLSDQELADLVVESKGPQEEEEED